MIDREKVIDRNIVIIGLKEIREHLEDERDSLAGIITDTIILLTRDQYYLQKLDSKAKAAEDSIPIKPLAEWLAGYAAPPRDAMRSTIQPGGSITHETLTAAWEKTLREVPYVHIYL